MFINCQQKETLQNVTYFFKHDVYVILFVIILPITNASE